MSSLRDRRPALSSRYEATWGAEFWRFVDGALAAGISVLDVGAGRRPTITPERRPADTHYVGLDVSTEELETAPAGSYDEIVGAGAETLVPELVDRFDLIVSWQALEHVRDMSRAASAFYDYANPRGWFVGVLSGRNAIYAVANRALPSAIGAVLVSRLRRRPLETVFAAHYDQCTDRGLKSAFGRWQELHVIPLYHAADYFDRTPRIQRAYVRFEDWAQRTNRRNLATHYVVAARKAS